MTHTVRVLLEPYRPDRRSERRKGSEALTQPGEFMRQMDINGQRVEAKSGNTSPVINFATRETLTSVPHRGAEDARSAIIVAQAAFLSPPVAMSAFYLKGVSPKHVTLNSIFAGMMPYMLIVILCLVFMYLWPGMTLWLPAFLYGN